MAVHKHAMNPLTPSALRRLILDRSYDAHVGHIGSSLSIVEILVALFDGVIDRPADTFILSKGHAALAYYCTLHLLGKVDAASLATIGSHGLGGDLLFAAAGVFWASFGTLLRLWRVPGLQAAAVVSVVSIGLFAPLYFVFVGFDNMIRMGFTENLLQAVVQGIFAGAGPIFLFARSVMLLGAGRAATFPALVPGFAVVVGYLALGVVPGIPQLIGLAIVAVTFRRTPFVDVDEVSALKG